MADPGLTSRDQAQPVGSLQYTAKAIVVGLEGNGLGVSRALNRRGIDTIGVGVPGWHATYATRSCEIRQCASWCEESLVETLLEIGAQLDEKAPILITKDEPVLWISRHREALAPYFEIRLPSPSTVDLMMSKIQFLDVARANGWPTPLTLIVNSLDELDAILDQVPFPSILKPAVKNSAFRANSPAKAYRVSSAAELRAQYQLIAQWEASAVIQEWIPGGDDRIGYCLACFSKDSQPLALFAGRKLRQFPVDCGNTAVAAPAPTDWVGPINELSAEILAYLGYQGIGSIEYKMRPNGEPVIMEPTVGRTNWQNEIAVLNGTDIPCIAYHDMAGLPPLPASRDTPPCKLVDGRAHRRALAQLHRENRLSVSQWLSERSGRKRYLMWRVDDPAPFLSATVGKTLRWFWHLPGRVLRKIKSKF